MKEYIGSFCNCLSNQCICCFKKYNYILSAIITLIIIINFYWLNFSINYYNNLYNQYNTNWIYYINDTETLSYIKHLIAMFPLWLILSVKGLIEFHFWFFKDIIFYKSILNEVDNLTYYMILVTNIKLIALKYLIVTPNEYTIFFNVNIISNVKNLILNFCNLELNINFINSYPLFIYFGLLFLATTIFSLICLNYLGLYGVFIVNLVSIILFWLSMLYYFNLIVSKDIFYYINIGKWMYLSSGFRVSFDLLIDTTSISFSFLTLTIGVFVYIYTFSYFRYEPLVERLILFLNTFMLSMILLVSSGNFIVMFLGWELIGLTSFFLINFWSTKVGTLKAAFKAFSFNKVSDLFLFFAILLIFNAMYTLDLLAFNNQIHLYEAYNIEIFYFSINLIEIISFFFIGCAFIKSAQIGAHIWLPDSMEAPVPASALIHSATLVSAGIYLLLRLTPLFEISLYAHVIIPIVGSVTAFYGGIVSAFQSDTKKTLAYSTISHCGFLMVAYSTGVLEFVILYLYVHGFFKAATFLCMGNVNRFNRNIQDFKRMGGFYKYLPFECLASFVCMLNLSGLPLTLGFYIKHILLIGLKDQYLLYYFILSSIILGAIAGVFYSYRLLYSIFFDVKKGKKTIYIQASRKNLNSIYYSNTTIAASISIFLLVIVSYTITIYLYSITLNKYYTMSDLKTISINNAYSYYYQPDLNFLNAVSILNWIVIILVAAVVFINWRKTYHHNNSIDNLGKFLLFITFFFIFSKYIL